MKQIQDRFQLEIELLRLEQQVEENNAALRQAKFDLREAKVAEAEYRGSFKSFRDKLAGLPDWESLKDGSPLWNRLEALYCLEILSPMLEATHDLLTQRRNQFNGTNAGQIKTRHTLAEIYSAPEAAGEACKPYLLRLRAALEELGNSLELHSFFDAPTAYLSNATQFTRMDRINTAIGQTEALQKRLPELQNELSK